MPFLDAPKMPLNIYKKIGLGFITLTVIMLFAVAHMALSRATIIVSPDEKEIGADLLASVRETELHAGDITGKIGIMSLSREASFPVQGTGEEKPAKARGTAVIYNNNNRNQTLVASTRLLSKEGILFRIDNNVTVPAGGSIKVAFAADKEGKSGEIGPAKFTIPGLPASLQTKIYAESTEPATGGTTRSAAVSSKDISEAAEHLKTALISEASEQLKKSLNGDGRFAGVVFKDAVKNAESNAKVGEVVSEFKIKIDIDVIGVAYDAALQDQAARTLSGMIASDRKLVSSNILNAVPVIEKYDLEDKSANLRMDLVGKTIINAESPVFDREKLSGMNTEEVRKYLEKYAGIKSMEVEFFPFWIKKVPKFRDHIKVVIK